MIAAFGDFEIPNVWRITQVLPDTRMCGNGIRDQATLGKGGDEGVKIVESKEDIDLFINTMKAIAAEAKDNPDLLREAPQRAKRRRLDETAAARNPCLRG